MNVYEYLINQYTSVPFTLTDIFWAVYFYWRQLTSKCKGTRLDGNFQRSQTLFNPF